MYTSDETRRPSDLLRKRSWAEQVEPPQPDNEFIAGTDSPVNAAIPEAAARTKGLTPMSNCFSGFGDIRDRGRDHDSRGKCRPRHDDDDDRCRPTKRKHHHRDHGRGGCH